MLTVISDQSRWVGSDNWLRALHLPFDGANPYQRLLFEALKEKGIDCIPDGQRWDIVRAVRQAEANLVHFHWLTPWATKTRRSMFGLKLVSFVLQLAWLRMRSVPIIWTVHNLKDHERRAPVRDGIMARLLARLSDAVIVHSKSARDQVLTALPVRPSRLFIVPHGTFIEVYPNTIDPVKAKQILGIPRDELVYLFLGNVRHYKGVIDLVTAYKRAGIKHSHLVIVGSIFDDIRDEIESAVLGESSIHLYGRRFVDEELQNFFNASDIVVLPYRDLLTSSAVILAMSFGRPCIVPAVPVMEEVLGRDAALYFKPGDVNDLCRCLQVAASNRDALPQMGQRAFARSERLPWEEVAAKTADIYCTSEKYKKRGSA